MHKIEPRLATCSCWTTVQQEQAIVPVAVHRELAQTDLLTQLLAIPWIDVTPVEPSPDETLQQDSAFQALGSGEQAIKLPRYWNEPHQAKRFASVLV